MEIPDREALGLWVTLASRLMTQRLTHLLADICRQQGRDYILTPPQASVVFALLHEDGAMVSALVQRIHTDAPTMTGIIHRLERVDLVRREHDTVDRRVVRVFLTAEGRAIAPHLPAALAQVNDEIAQAIAPEQAATIIHGLRQIVAAFAPGSAPDSDA